DSCRMIFEQYQQIASEVIPVMASSAALEARFEPEPSSFSLHAAEKRLMSRLDPVPIDQVTKAGKPGWRTYAGAVAACITVAAVLIAFPLRRSKSVSLTTSAPVVQIESKS